MAAARRVQTEEYLAADEAARGVRAVVAEQLQALVVEADRMSSRGEFAQAVERIVAAERMIASARARQRQAYQLGMPVASHVRAEREGESLLRDAVMQCAVTCGGWAAAMDFEKAYREAAEG